jgi:hypothetical protein
MPNVWIKVLLVVCGIYDGGLGLVALLLPATVFRLTGVTPPNHMGYVQFPALLLLIFAVMFFRAASDPVARRETIVYGMALKLSYFGLVFYYRFHGGVPTLWIPCAFADIAFFALFIIAWRRVSNN